MGALLTLENVTVSYRNGRRTMTVLENVSLDLEHGDILGVWGGRRSGKTTLANVAAGLIRPDSGRVLLDGRDLPQPGRLRRQRLHESVALVHGGRPDGPPDRRRVIDHVGRRLRRRYGRRAAHHHAVDALERLGLLSYANERWGALTHRDRVLVAFADALASMPKLLVLDDFALGVDPLQRDQLSAVLRDAAATLHLGILLTSDSIGDLIASQRLGSLQNGELRSPQAPTEVIPFPVNRRSA